MSEENKSLWALTSELAKIEEMLADPAVDNSASLVEMIQTKLDGCVEYTNHLSSYVEAIDKRMEELNSFKQKALLRQDSFEKYMKDAISQLGVSEIKGKLYKIKIRKPSKVVSILSEKDVPLKFKKMVTTFTIDKKAIKAAIEAKEEVTGATIADGKASIIISGAV